MRSPSMPGGLGRRGRLGSRVWGEGALVATERFERHCFKEKKKNNRSIVIQQSWPFTYK